MYLTLEYPCAPFLVCNVQVPLYRLKAGGGARGGGDAFSNLFAGSATGANEAKNTVVAARMNLEKQRTEQQQSSG